MHNVPVMGMSERIGLKFGSMIGEVLELDGGAMGLCLGNFLHIRICIVITKPLLRAINMVWVKGEDPVSVFLSYERLPKLSMICGLLDHMVRECPLLVENTKILPNLVWKYKSWIKAQSLVCQRNNGN